MFGWSQLLAGDWAGLSVAEWGDLLIELVDSGGGPEGSLDEARGRWDRGR